ncbi:MAG: ABC transporter permease [Gammaproteobacteria bacterium]|nr:ABC transporter permease [Gammaproteobacteria bacterium]
MTLFGVRFVFLATDVLLWLLAAIVAAYAWHAGRQEHLRAPWREVAKRPLGMAGAVVLAAYAAVALLDSVHFFPRVESGGKAALAAEAVSAFDVLVMPLKTHVEATYSAPLASYAYEKESVDLPGGGIAREYPRLRYGGAGLGDPAREHRRDVLRRSTIGFAAGLAAEAGIACLVIVAIARRRRSSVGAAARLVATGGAGLPWRAMLGVGAALCAFAGIAAALGPHYHVFGTDKIGTDVLYQTLKSVRTGLVIGTLTTVVTLPLAFALGIAAGYFRGWVDDAIQYLYTTLSSIPGVLLIAAAALVLQVHMAKHADQFGSLAARADLRLLALCVILGITGWTGLCRLLRGEAMKLREVEFVDAARALGVRHGAILARHLAPNVMHIVMISVVLDFSGLVLAEAALTYINIGVDPSMESWGNMINSARLELAREPVVWWPLAAAFCFMFALVLAANLFADSVRDAFDPRLRRDIG